MVFSLAVWVFSLLLCHAASQLISVISAVSGHGKASKALMCILISPPCPEEQPGTASLWDKTPLHNAASLRFISNREARGHRITESWNGLEGILKTI